MTVKKMLKLSTVTLFLLVVLGLLIFTAKADTVDDAFETARGQLLAFYGSEVVSHTGIILGLLVGLFSIAKLLWSALNHQRQVLRFFGVFIPILVGIGLVFSGGRLVYWSDLGLHLIHSDRTSVGFTVDNSNVTSCIGAFENSAISQYANDPRWFVMFARAIISWDWWGWWLSVGILLLVPSGLWAFYPKKCSELRNKLSNSKA